METQASKFPNPLIWTAGIAIVVFCAAGTAAIMGWIPTSIGGSGERPVLGVAENPQSSPARPAVKPHAAPVRVAAAPVAPVPAKCAECGRIESTREVVTKGEGSGIGIAGGAVVGGVVGHQVGRGTTQQVATVVGAVGGAVAGNEIEKRVKSTKSYEVTVRMDDGSSRVIHEASAPTWRTGDHVKIVDGTIRAI